MRTVDGCRRFADHSITRFAFLAFPDYLVDLILANSTNFNNRIVRIVVTLFVERVDYLSINFQTAALLNSKSRLETVKRECYDLAKEIFKMLKLSMYDRVDYIKGHTDWKEDCLIRTNGDNELNMILLGEHITVKLFHGAAIIQDMKFADKFSKSFSDRRDIEDGRRLPELHPTLKEQFAGSVLVSRNCEDKDHVMQFFVNQKGNVFVKTLIGIEKYDMYESKKELEETLDNIILNIFELCLFGRYEYWAM